MAFHKGIFAIVALRVLPECKEHLKKILKEEWYILNGWYELKGKKLEKRGDVELYRDLYGENVSISAIVGKNGSGKSSLMELIYRIVNNLDFCMMQGVTTVAAWPLLFIEGLCAELHFESQGKLGVVRCNNYTVEFQWGEDDIITYHADNLNGFHDETTKGWLEYISRHFCYSLVSNYAMMSLNPGDYWRDFSMPLDNRETNGNWLDSIYNKNDGYTAAIGIEPFKGEGVINLYTQKKLCQARLVGILIETAKKGVEFFDGYSYNEIKLSVDAEYIYKQINQDIDYKKGGSHPDLELPNLLKDPDCFASIILKSYGFDNLNTKDPVVMLAAVYLVFKTLHIARIYPKYQEYKSVGQIRYYARNTKTFDRCHNKRTGRFNTIKGEIDSKQMLENLVATIKKDDSHVTLKIRQTLNFLKEVKTRYENIGYNWECPEFKRYEDYMQLFNSPNNAYEHIYDNADNIIEFFPPSFFKTEIYLNRKKSIKGKQIIEVVPFERLSSGEHQFIQTTVSIIYHIKNLISVADTKGNAKYYNINLFVDEIEACFHPEYQQKFIKLFLGMLRGQELTEKCNINIIIATHSPFILSDILGHNVIYLDNGSVIKDNDIILNPLCSNVCDMLRHSFFLKKGFMGEWSRDMVNDLINYLRNHKNNRNSDDSNSLYEWSEDKAKAFIGMIGEPILKGSLMNFFSEVFNGQEELLAWHMAEINKIKQKTTR